ncbi:MAG: hypothetical protein J6336_03885 [Kiritimatiellae bacterium]|nr:hypothetical protein [Kiritimatiellia bacterium]
MREGLHGIDYAVIIAFFAAMIAVGLFFSRKAKNTDLFFGGDKSVPWWLSGISFYMNSFSALAFVMYSALAYQYGWVPVTISWLSVPAVLLGARFLAVRWRRAATRSPIDYIAVRYTPKMCGVLAWLGLPMQFLDNAFKLLSIGIVVGIGMGFPLDLSIAASGAIIVLYTFLGGLKATLVCDFIQFFVILAVVFALPPLCLNQLAALDGGTGMVHGFEVFLQRVPKGFFALTAGKYNWAYMVVFFLLVGSTLSTNWSLVQRYYSTKSEKDAKKMAYLVAVLLFLGPPLFFFPAMAARIFLPEVPADQMNGVYALLCRKVLPVGMIGMVIAAMFSATMSTLAGNFNAVASVMTNDLYRRFDPNATPRRLMIAARVATLITGALVIGLTFLMQYVQGADDLFNLTNKAFGVFLPPIAIPMLAGLFIRRLSRRAGLVGLVAGIAMGLAAFIAGTHWPALRELIPMYCITASTTLLALAVGSRFLPDSPADREAVHAFVDRLEA